MSVGIKIIGSDIYFSGCKVAVIKEEAAPPTRIAAFIEFLEGQAETIYEKGYDEGYSQGESDCMEESYKEGYYEGYCDCKNKDEHKYNPDMSISKDDEKTISNNFGWSSAEDAYSEGYEDGKDDRAHKVKKGLQPMTKAAEAKVSLINYTADAAELLIFTKQTRLELSPNLLQEIKDWPEEKKLEELRYMANTIPSSWEFSDYTFLITGVSRAFTHQFVRTRQGSYAQQTMRILNVQNYEYVYPERELTDQQKQYIKYASDAIKLSYHMLIDSGAAIEDARGILPTNIATNIVAKFNLRTLSEMCKSRTGGRTQGEYQKIMRLMAAAVIAVHPWAEMFLFPDGKDFYDDIEKFAAERLGGNQKDRTDLLKIVDKMRKAGGSNGK